MSNIQIELPDNNYGNVCDFNSLSSHKRSAFVFDIDGQDSSVTLHTNSIGAVHVDKNQRVCIGTYSATSALNVNSVFGECIHLLNESTSNSADIDIDTNGYLSISSSKHIINFPNHNGVDKGIQLNGDLLTATATELNYMSNTTAGTASANKALIFDSSRNITNINSISIAGTTASTSVITGVLNMAGGISISNNTDATDVTNGGTFTTAGGASFAKSVFIGTDLTVTGNLHAGLLTSTNSENIYIAANLQILNSGPSSSGYDSGLLNGRYQVENTAGTGDIIGDIVQESYNISAATTTSITLPVGANTTTDFYKGWWLKMASGIAINHVKKNNSIQRDY